MSTRPTRAEIQRIKDQIVQDLAVLQTCIDKDGVEALVSVQNFVAIALEVFATVNTSKLRDALILVETRMLMAPARPPDPARLRAALAAAAAENAAKIDAGG